MFKAIWKHLIILGSAIMLAGIQSVDAQDLSSTDALFDESLASFRDGQYSNAFKGFDKLRMSRPEDPRFSYYTGRCLAEMNRNLDKAIEYLHYAASRKEPPEAVFHLGRAHHLNYNFQEAVKYYQAYQSIATRQELKESRTDYQIEVCREAIKLTSTYNQYKVMTVAFMDLTDSAQYRQIKMKGGHLQRKPLEYADQYEDPEGLSELMFVPKQSLRGEYAFFSGYSRGKKEGLQIFRVKKGPGNRWGNPEEMKELCSKGDEILPYFDPIENDLYYASNGKGGIGGYDLYRSHYDNERDQWSEPINLGFPVNSVRDEVLLLPGTDLGMVMFFSNRAGTDSTMAVYRVHLVEPKETADTDDFRLLAEIASLGGAAEEILADIEGLRASNESTVNAVADRAQDPVMPVRATEDIEVNRINKNHLILAGALAHQASSDSLRDLANIARLKVRESKDPNDRWIWQKQIMVWEKKAADEQALADQSFRKIRDQENTEQVSAVNIPETIEVDTVVEELTVYRFKKPQDNSDKAHLEGEPGVQPPRVKDSSPGGKQETIHRFDVLPHSPYSEINPIPLDVSLPEGVLYRIQVGVYSQPVEPGGFRGLSPITGETIKDRGLYKYYAGKFSLYKDAANALSTVRAQGYADAFIVAWHNGKLCSTQRAQQYE